MFFAPWVDTPGTLGLLYVPCSTDAWSDSKMRIVEVARKRWLRMEKNEKETAWAPCYPDPKSDLGEPNFPVDKTLDDYLQAAFGDYLIIDETHLVVRRLRGLTKY